jgi:hypothetical protein
MKKVVAKENSPPPLVSASDSKGERFGITDFPIVWAVLIACHSWLPFVLLPPHGLLFGGYVGVLAALIVVWYLGALAARASRTTLLALLIGGSISAASQVGAPMFVHFLPLILVRPLIDPRIWSNEFGWFVLTLVAGLLMSLQAAAVGFLIYLPYSKLTSTKAATPRDGGRSAP